jgi:hypothetical protein
MENHAIGYIVERDVGRETLVHIGLWLEAVDAFGPAHAGEVDGMSADVGTDVNITAAQLERTYVP